MAKIYYKRHEIEQQVEEIVLEVIVTAKEDDLNLDTKLGADGLGADSLDIMEIAMHLEKTFGITITDYQMNDMQSYTVEQLCNMVEDMTK